MSKWYCDKCNFKSRKTNNIKIHKYSHRYDNKKINLNLNNEFNKNIDGIVYINLKHRTQRNQHIKNELELYNFNTEKIYRIDAVHNKDCGHLGCCQSHIKALEFAQLNKWKNILIFEDDFIFTKDYLYVSNNLSEIFNKDFEWDVFLLTGTNIGNAFKKNIYNNKNFKKTIRSATASAYIVKEKYYNKLKNLFKECEERLKIETKIHLEKMKNKKDLRTQWTSTSRSPARMLQYTESAIDHEWIKLQEIDNFFIFDPPLGKQNELFNGNFQGNDT